MAEVAVQADHELADRVVAFRTTPADFREAFAEQEGRGGIRARGQNGLQIRRNERVGHRNQKAGAADRRVAGRRRRREQGAGDIGRVVELGVGVDVLDYLMLDAGEGVVALERNLQVVERTGVVGAVHRDRREVDRSRTLVVLSVEKQRAIVVEAEAVGRGFHRAGGDAVLGEHGVDDGLRRQVRADRVIGAQRAGARGAGDRRERPRGVPDVAAVRIPKRNDRVALVVVEVAAEQQADILGLAVVAISGAVLDVSFDALEVLLQAEVDHAGDSVGTVGRRGAASDHLDALNEAGRNGVEVDRAVGVRRRDAPAVHQHQRALGAQTAKLDIGLAGAARVVRRRRHRRNELRHLVQQGFHRHRAGLLQCFRADRHDRSVGFVVVAHDPRTGDDDAFNFVVGGGSGRGGRRDKSRQQGGAAENRRRQQALARCFNLQDDTSVGAVARDGQFQPS